MPKYNVKIKVEAQSEDINFWNDIARAAVSNLAGKTYAPIFNVNSAGGLISIIDIDSCKTFTPADLQQELVKLARIGSQDQGRIQVV